MKRPVKILLSILIGALFGCFFYVHRNVIAAAIKGEPLPKAPKWHFWCPNRRNY